MFASDRASRPRGFSLVELLVALIFTSILMTGMFRVLASATSTFAAGSETLNVQRKARWGLQLLQDDVLQAGHLLFRRVVSEIDPTSDSTQPPLLMQTTDYAPEGAEAGAKVDELQFVADLPLNIQGTLASGVATGANALSVTVPSGRGSIQAGDMVFLQDSAWEIFQVKEAPAKEASTSFDLKIVDEQAALVDQYGKEVSSLIHALTQKDHLAGAQFSVFRPLRVVRYAVVPRKLNPANTTESTPCLVRQTQDLATHALTFWQPAKDTPANDEQILLENVTGFSVNWSLNGGKTWLRTSKTGNPPWDEANWATIRKSLNEALAASNNVIIKKAQGGTNPEDPFWMNYCPVLIRIDLEIRSQIKRTEYKTAASGSAGSDYRRRRETLLLSPRNFALGPL